MASAEVGIPCEFPNYLLQHNFPLTWAINATNYAAHCFMLNSSLLKNTCNFTISDEENFTYNTGNYTLWALPMLIPGQNWAGTIHFQARQTAQLGMCLWVGTLEDAFNTSAAFNFYRYGGFF